MVQMASSHFGVSCRDFTNEAQIGVGALFAGAEDVAVAASEADGLLAEVLEAWRRGSC